MVGKSSQDKHGGATRGNVRELVVRTKVFSTKISQKLYAADTSNNRKEQTNPKLEEREALKNITLKKIA